MPNQDINHTEVHLCVIIHGFWGNTNHMNRLASAALRVFSKDTQEILVVTQNEGSLTYDGIDVGGERVAHEIESHIFKMENTGKKTVKLSMIGYSFGGLLARYAIGILYARNRFEKIQPVNFTTFATPHLGIRAPSDDWYHKIWNYFIGRTLSVSGHQLLLIDSFSDTGRPLLTIMAEENSIFMQGLCAFQQRSVYANITNDHTVPFYTAYICAIDPFVDLSTMDIIYTEGYGNVILDAKIFAKLNRQQTSLDRLLKRCSSSAKRLSMSIVLTFLVIPTGITLYLVNSYIQSHRSARRIKTHNSLLGNTGTTYNHHPTVAAKRICGSGDSNIIDRSFTPLQSDRMVSSSRSQSIIPLLLPHPADCRIVITDTYTMEDILDMGPDKLTFTKPSPLALTDDQYRIIQSFTKMGIEKYAVHIHKTRHSHAAIIHRKEGQRFSEGEIVIQHWLERFKVHNAQFWDWLRSLISLFPNPNAALPAASDSPKTPSQDYFHTAPPNFAILRHRVALGNLSTITGNCSTAYNILYRTPNSKYQPSWAVTTLFIPSSGPNSSATRTGHALLSYHIPHNSINIDQSPSYTLYSEPITDIATALSQAWYVNVPDIEGPKTADTQGVQEGHAVLDSVRAVLASDFGPQN